MTAKTRLGLSVLTALATCGAPAACGQTLVSDRGAPALTMTFSYTGEFVQSVAGGARRGATFPGVAGAQLTLSLGRVVGWHGASVYVLALGTHGGAPSAFVGDVQGVSNLEAPSPATVRLEEAWLQQNLFDNRLSWLVGRYDLNTEFYRLQSGALFINSSFGIGPEFSHSGRAGPSIFLTTAVGTRFDFKPSPGVVWRAAVLDGPMVISEVALVARPDTAAVPRHRRFAIGRGSVRSYAGKLALGAWYYTARFSDLSDTTLHRGSGGAYLIADQTLFGTLTAFVQLGLGDGRVNQIGGYAGGGLTLTAPFSGRAQDVVGLAAAAARNGSHYERAQTTGGIPAAGETTVELTYLAQFGPWLSVQPDVQYVIHPAGTAVLRNAMALGLRVAVSH